MLINIPVIVGATSSGKTKLALQICQKRNWQIISADSRQIYKDMNIGTGKIPVGENIKIIKEDQKWILNDVTIWGYDLISPDKYFSSYDYSLFATQKINELIKKGITPLIVGGTGFYIDVLTKKVKLAGVEPDFELREELELMGVQDLLNKLKKLNSSKLNLIDKNNKARLVRAVEVEINKETPLKELPNFKEKINFQLLGLNVDRNVLYSKVDNWTDYIYKNGLIEETKDLIKKYPKSPKLTGLVYGSVVKYLNSEVTLDEAVQRSKFDLHAYIRRQQTYFKKDPCISWKDADSILSLF